MSRPATTRCTATRHGTLTAYVKHRCRCASARAVYSTYKRSTRRGQPGMLPAVATVRIVRGLQRGGHSSRTIAAAAGLSSHTTAALARQELGAHQVHERTARAVVAAARHLVRVRGTSRITADYAAAAGWAPLHAWHREHLPIDDPTIPDAFAAHVAHHAPPLRGLLLAERRQAEAELSRIRERQAEGGRAARRNATAA